VKCITEHLNRAEGMLRLLEIVRGGQLPCSLLRVADGAKPYLYGELGRSLKRTVFVACATEYEAKRQYAGCYSSARLYIPAPHIELRPIEAKSAETSRERVRAIGELAGGPRIVFLSLDALLYKMRSPVRFFEAFRRICRGMEISPHSLMEYFFGMGYERAALVESVGLCSGRGEIVEIFPPNSEHPLRITFFDQEIESIRYFDEDSQRSFGEGLEEVCISPATEFCLAKEERETLAHYFQSNPNRKLRESAGRILYELEQKRPFANMEAYSGVLDDHHSLVEYARDSLILFDDYRAAAADYDKRQQARQALFGEIMQQQDAFGCENDTRVSPDAFLEAYGGRTIDLAGIGEEKRLSRRKVDFGMRSAVGFRGNMEMLSDAVRSRVQDGYQVYLFAGGKSKQLSAQLEEYGLVAPPMSGRPLDGPGVCCVSGRIRSGFELPEKRALYLSEEEIFGRASRKPSEKRSREKQSGDTLLADLKAGDIVVHEVHGKGRFLGLKNMDVAGARADYIELEYRDGDKLYIQTSQIDRVQKYIGPGDGEGEVRLSKLGGKEWENAKAKARQSVKKLAEDLVELYRQRSALKGYRFSKDTVWQSQFEDSFEFEETPGQLESIRQIKRDMQSDKIMDRLLLGDVGYGKTEVAMRACFKAVMDSRQVAVLVPTTLLARQHYETFKERFAGFPVRIAMLSRFSKDAAKTLEDLAQGRVDIVIGTHKLLGKKVRFRDLGLLVIDEEQRFGVSHKERLKDLRKEVDVLTLTATPIPRTLEMALTGMRDMSTIATPPEERKEVQAYVAEFSWGLVREAIMNELHRGGQIYFVLRRVTGMEEIAKQLSEVAPEARVVAAHGQMSESIFERNVTAFYERQYDVLLCTTIIESGIDIPSVNTIIVYEADKFGLSQLYQLKGRVGRSSLQAYAYFTHLKEDRMSELAARRLAAVREFTQFGSGLKIAMRDLEIRGAGNILGAEQSGHMAQIGYSLYCKLVKEQVQEVMGMPPPEEEGETTVEMAVNAYIPSGYIPEEEQKLDMYRRVQAVSTLEEARAAREEFADRFGKAPPEVENLLGASVVRGYAHRAGIASVIRKGALVELRFRENAQIDLQKLMGVLQNHRKNAEFRRSTPPVVLFRMEKSKGYGELLQLMEQIRHCICLTNQV